MSFWDSLLRGGAGGGASAPPVAGAGPSDPGTGSFWDWLAGFGGAGPGAAGYGVDIIDWLTGFTPPTNWPGFGDPEATEPGDTTTIPETPGVGGNVPGGTGEQTIPTEGDIARQTAGIQNLQTRQFQISGANTILGMKSQERQGVGAMRSRAAGRNVDVRGSPLFNIAAKQAESEQQIALAGESLEQSVDIQGKVRDVGWNSFLLSGAKETAAAAQANADMWMNIFTDVLRIAGTIVTGFPIPDFSIPSGAVTNKGKNPWTL
jgi:hypothetical protein